MAIILTKGTKSLAEQTVSLVKEDFREFILADQIDVFDIFAVPDLTPYELSRKLVFVVKKEDDNLKRLLDLFRVRYPALRQKSVLIIDDEADLASVSFRRANGINAAGVISQQIDQLRDSVTNSAFLQVTATPVGAGTGPGKNRKRFFGLPSRPRSLKRSAGRTTSRRGCCIAGVKDSGRARQLSGSRKWCRSPIPLRNRRRALWLSRSRFVAVKSGSRHRCRPPWPPP